MLANAKDDDRAVGLKLRGQKSAWPYPAELLSLKSESLSPLSSLVELPDRDVPEESIENQTTLGDSAFCTVRRPNTPKDDAPERRDGVFAFVLLIQRRWIDWTVENIQRF